MLIVFLLGFAPVSHAQDKTTFPTDDEIQLLLTQADRAIQQYEPLIDQEEQRLGKRGAENIATDRQVVKAIKLAIETFRKQPQGLNSSIGFAFFEWLDDASRNALMCSQTAMSQSAVLAMVGQTENALKLVHFSDACLDASTLIYTVSENAGSLYTRYVTSEEGLANTGVSVSQQCAAALKKLQAERKQ
jgi:hypothetical protein